MRAPQFALLLLCLGAASTAAQSTSCPPGQYVYSENSMANPQCHYSGGHGGICWNCFGYSGEVCYCYGGGCNPWWSYSTLYYCTACPVGHYNPSWNTNWGCQPCPAGTYQSGRGATGCSACPPGTYSGTGYSYCPQCPAGSHASAWGSPRCDLCALGYYSSSPGWANCAPCQPGSHANSPNTGATQCVACSPGTYQPNPVAYPGQNFRGDIGCQVAGAGTYVPQYGASRYLPCPGGTANANTGQSYCRSCITDVTYASPLTPGVLVGASTCSNCVDLYPAQDRAGVCHDCDLIGEIQVKSGWCFLANYAGVPGCVRQGALEDAIDKNPDNACHACVPGYDVWQPLTGTPCNDTKMETYTDTCHAGTCMGTYAVPLGGAPTPYAPCLMSKYTDNDALDCEELTGLPPYGCTQTSAFKGCIAFLPPYGPPYKRTCGCKIGAQCFAHHTTNPENTCEWCDVLTSSTTWTPTPPKACNDNYPCSYDDTCDGKGHCSGTLYSCHIAPLPVCLARQPACDGLGGCTYSFLSNSTQCLPALDACTPAIYCNGSYAACPPQLGLPPSVHLGAVIALDPVTQLPTPVSPVTSAMTVSTFNFSAACGGLHFIFAVYPDPDATRVCAYPSGTHFTDWSLHQSAVVPSSSVAGSLLQGARYRAIVTVANSRGSSLSACSDVIAIDTTPPSATAAVIRNVDPLRDDGITNCVAHAGFTLNFTIDGFAEDVPESSYNNVALAYEFSVQSWPVGGDVAFAITTVKWTALPIVMQVPPIPGSAPGPFATGMTYRVGVRARNRANLTSNVVYGTPVIIDRVGPLMPALGDLALDAFGAPYVTTVIGPGSNRTLYMANWSGPVTAASGIASASIAFGAVHSVTSVTGGYNALPLSSVAAAGLSSFVGVPRAAGLYYVASLVATSASGVEGNVTSPGLAYDDQPPQFVNVWVGQDVGAYVQSPTLAVGSLIAPSFPVVFTELESYVVAARVRIANGTFAPARVTSSTPHSYAVLTANASSSPLIQASTVTFCAVLINALGLASNTSAVTSCAPFLVDALPPSAFAVMDEDHNVPDVQTSFTTSPLLRTRWNAASAVSGIACYAVRVTRSAALVPGGGLAAPGPGPITILDWTPVSGTVADFGGGGSNSSRLPVINISNSQGLTFYTSVRATSWSGLATIVTSRGILYDTTPPIALPGLPCVVCDGPAAGTETAYSRSGVWSASWPGIVDPESGIAAFSWAVDLCGSVGGEGLLHLTSVSLNRTGTTSGLGDTEDSRVCTKVVATNAVGLPASFTSGGAVIDDTPPLCAGLRNGVPGVWLGDFVPAAYAPINASNVTLGVVALEVVDPESGVVSWTVQLTTADDGTVLVPWFSPPSSSVAAPGVSISPSATVSLPRGTIAERFLLWTVRFVNGAGETTTVTSPPLLLDDTPPVNGSVIVVGAVAGTDATGPLLFVQSSTVQLQLVGFSDNVTGVADLTVLIGGGQGTNLTSYDVGLNTEPTISIDNPLRLSRIFVTVIVTNNAGLSARTAMTVPLVVDTGVTCGAAAMVHAPALGPHLDTWLSADGLRVVILNVSSPSSGIAAASYTLGSTAWGLQATRIPLPLPGFLPLRGSHAVGPLVVTANLSSLWVAPETQYVVTVAFTSATGFSCSTTTPPFSIEPIAPPAPPVFYADAAAPCAANASLIANVSGLAEVPPTGPFDTLLPPHASCDLFITWVSSPDVSYTLGYGTSIGDVSASGGWVNTFAHQLVFANDTSVGTQAALGGPAHAAVWPSNSSFPTAGVYYMQANATFGHSGAGVSSVGASQPVLADVLPIALAAQPVPVTAAVALGPPVAGTYWIQPGAATLQLAWPPAASAWILLEYKAALWALSGASCNTTHTAVPPSSAWQSAGVALGLAYVWPAAPDPALFYALAVSATSAAGTVVATAAACVRIDGTPPTGGHATFIAIDAVLSSFSTSADVLTADVVQGVAPGANGVGLPVSAGATVRVAWWGFSDGTSAVTSYAVAIGTSPGAADVTDFVTVGTGVFSNASAVVSASLSGLLLPHGSRAFATVRGLDAAGNAAFATSSDAGVPVVGTPCTALGFTVTAPLAQADGASITAHWTAPGGLSGAPPVTAPLNDPTCPTGFSHYEAAVGTAPGSSDLASWRPVGNAQTATMNGLNMTNGARVYFSVRAVSRIGLVTTVSSPPILIDTSPPLAGGIYVPLVSSGAATAVTWDPFEDDESGIVGYEAAASFNGMWVVPWLSLGPSVAWVVPSLPSGSVSSLTSDEFDPLCYGGLNNAASFLVAAALAESSPMLVVAVRATNGVGAVSPPALSAPIFVDSTPPMWPSSAAVHVTAVEATFVVSFPGASVPTHPGLPGQGYVWGAYVASYEGCVGYSPGGCQVMDWRVLDLGDAPLCAASGDTALVTFPTLPLSQDSVAYVSVRALSVTGVPGVPLTSSAVLVDVQPPGSFSVLDGIESDPALWGVGPSAPVIASPFLALGCHWTAPAASGAVGFTVAIGRLDDGSNDPGGILNWTYVGAARGFNVTLPHALQNGQYACTVVAANLGSGGVLGNISSSARSPGAWVDRRPPMSVGAWVRNGGSPPVNSPFALQRDSLTAYWANFSAFKAPIAAYSIDVLAAPCNASAPIVVSELLVGDVTFASIDGLNLTEGGAYCVSVSAVAANGLVSDPVIATPVVVDSLPPAVTDAARRAAATAAAVLDARQRLGQPPYSYAAADAPPLNASWLTIGVGLGAALSAPDRATCLPQSPTGQQVWVAGSAAPVCSPGFEPSPLGLCVPCWPGSAKPAAGNVACLTCPALVSASSSSAAEAAASFVDAAAAVALGGATTCSCSDPVLTVFDVPSLSCRCKPGMTDPHTQDFIAYANTLSPSNRSAFLASLPQLLAGLPRCSACRVGYFKSTVGDDVSLCSPCPARSSASPDARTCNCTDALAVFDPSALACVCGPGSYGTADVLTGVLSCTACPPGTFKAVTGGSAEQCVACPWATRPNADGSSCEGDPSVVSRAVYDAVASVGACPPGTSLSYDASRSPPRACVLCPQFTFQPVNISLLSPDQATACLACPQPPPTPALSLLVSFSRTVTVSWAGVFEDAGAGISVVRWALGSVPGGSQVLPFQSADPTTPAVTASIAVPPGEPVFLTLEAEDAAGRATLWINPTPVLLDSSPPLAGRAVDGTPDDIPGVGNATLSDAWRANPSFVSIDGVPDATYQLSYDSFNVTFEPFDDSTSGMAGVAACLGSARFACDLAPWAAVVAGTNVTLVTLTPASPVSPGMRVFAAIMAANEAGWLSLISTDGVTADARPPSPGIVRDGPPDGVRTQDVDCAPAGAAVPTTWRGFTSPSPLIRFEWALGTAPGLDDVLPFLNVGTSTFSPPALTNFTALVPLLGDILYATVRAWNAAGLSATASSDGVRYVCPRSGSVEAASLSAANSATAAACSSIVSGLANGESRFSCSAVRSSGEPMQNGFQLLAAM